MPEEEKFVFEIDLSAMVHTEDAMKNLQKLQSVSDKIGKRLEEIFDEVAVAVEDVGKAAEKSDELLVRMVRNMEKSVAVRMQDELEAMGGLAQKIIEAFLPHDADIETVTKTYKVFFDEIKKQQELFSRGLAKTDDPAKIFAARMEEVNQALIVYRNEILKMPKTTPLDAVARAVLANGKTIADVLEEVEKLQDGMLKRLVKTASEVPEKISDGFKKGVKKTRDIPDEFGDKIVDAVDKKLAKLPISTSENLAAVIKEVNTFGNLFADALAKTAEIATEPFVAKIRQMSDGIKESFRESEKEITKETERLFDNVEISISKALKDIGVEVAERSVDLFKPIAGFAKEVIEDTQEFLLRPIAASIARQFRPLGDALKETGVRVGESIADGIAASTTAIDAARSKVEDALSPIVDRASAIGKEAANQLTSNISVAAGKFSTIRNRIDSELRPVIQITGSIGRKAAEQMMDDLSSVVGEKLGPISSAIQSIMDAWKPLDDYMFDLGKRVGSNLINAMKDEIVLGTQTVAMAAKNFAASVGKSMISQLKYDFGRVTDIISGKSYVQQLKEAYKRAEDLGMVDVAKKLRDELTYLGEDIEDAALTMEHQMRVVRSSFGDTAKDVLASIDNITSGNVKLRDGISGLGTAFVGMGRVIGRHIGVTENMSTVNRRLIETVNFATRSLSGYRRENEILDPNLNRLANRTDKVSDTLKTQAQLTIKLAQDSRRYREQQVQAINQYISVLEKVQRVEQGGQMGEKTRQNLALAWQEAVKQLDELGLKEKILGDMSNDMEGLAAEIKKFGDTANVSISAQMTGSLQRADLVMGVLGNDVDKMRRSFPKAFQDINRAVMDVEENSKHFLTTLRDGGKISTERLQDILLPMQRMIGLMRELQKIGAVSPENVKYWEQVQRNILQEAENFALVAQRARVVEARKEKLFQATKKVTGSMKDLGRAAVKNLPLVGENAKLSAKDMEEFASATDRVKRTTSSFALSLGSIDPVLGDLLGGFRETGMVFNSVMEGMAQTTAVKTAAMAKSFNLLKIAAFGIIGIFSGLMISTGKLAAEVTTLGITMKTVGRNIGVPIPYLEHLVEVLKDTGITTRESISAITQWMRAGLSFQWKDATSGMTYGMKDLARAAQEIAVAMGENSSETFQRFIAFVQSGNSQLLKAVGIMKTANQMYEEHARALGKTVKALSIREKQEALISGLLRESTKLEGTYTEAMKSANKQLGSMKRYIEELRLEWGKHFEPLLASAIFHINQIIKLLTNIPDKAKQTITTFITLATAISGMVIGITILLPKLKLLINGFQILTGALFGKFGLILTAIGAVAAIIVKQFDLMGSKAKGVEGIVEKINILLESLGGIKGALAPITNWISGFMAMIGEHTRRISRRISVFIENINEKIQTFMSEHPEIASFLERARDVLADLFNVIWKVVDNVLSAVEALLDQDWDKFFDKLKMAGMYILTWITEFFNEVVTVAFEWGKNLISTFVSGIIQAARTAIPRAMSSVGQLIASFLEGHSPAKIGPLSTIDRWGGGLMNAFERGLRQRRILFDEDMFTGMGTLRAKARVWGDNVVGTFAAGISGKAAQALVPTMDYVGSLIARFLEGHSPPLAGRLSEIQDWGRNTFETFLAGFKMADFSILDTALSLVSERLNALLKGSENAAAAIARAMGQVREAVSGAIFQARATGGPLDLSSLRNMIVGGVGQVAQDIADVLEAAFAAAEAQAGVEALQEQIAAARAARKKAIQAAQDRIRAIRDQIEETQEAVEALEEQMEEEFKLRAEAAGILVDERLMEGLRREMERASVEVQRAQRRIERVRESGQKYGVNILTWEEINAQAQLDLAKQRQAEVQEQIWTQEEFQRQAEELRAKIEEEYQGRFDALQEELKALEKRSEAAQERLEAMQRADQDATEAENAQLAAAQKHAKQLSDHAALMAKLLDERLKAEKDALASATGVGGEDGGEPTYPDLHEMLGVAGLLRIKESWRKDLSDPELSDLFKDWWKKLLSGDISGTPDLWAAIKEEVEGVWDKFIMTPFGQWWEEIGAISFWETTASRFGEIIDAIGNFVARWANFFDYVVSEIFGVDAKQVSLWEGFNDALDVFFGIMEGIVDIVGKALVILIDLLALDFDKAAKGLEDLGRAFFEMFGITEKELQDWLGGIEDGINDINEWFGDMRQDVAEAVNDVVDAIIEPFRKLTEILVGKSIIPDLVSDIVDYIAGIPGKLLGLAGDFLDAARDIGKNIYDGISDKVGDIAKDIGTWMGDAAKAISGAAQDFWNNAWNVASNAYNAISDRVGNIKDEIGGWFSNASASIVSSAQDFWNNAWAAINNAYNAMSSRVGDIANDIYQWFVNVAQKISTVGSVFWGNTWLAAYQAYSAIYDVIMNPNTGIIAKIGGWISDVAGKIITVATEFYWASWELGKNIINGIKDAITAFKGGLAGIVKGIWNDYLRAGFNGVIQMIEDAINGIIAALNAAAAVLPGGWPPGFPLDYIDVPELPELAVGGIITQDVIAKLHAGEIVLPLERLGDIMRNMNIQGGVPAFAPIMNFYPGASPQQIMPAMHEAYDWYIEEQRRG